MTTTRTPLGGERFVVGAVVEVLGAPTGTADLPLGKGRPR